MKFKQYLLKLWNFWPPFFGAGIKVKEVSKDWRYLKAELKLRPWTSNYVGTQFGGSMFSMTDAFYMVMLVRNLGKDYIVWDRSATIRFLKPGKSHLTADFVITEEDLVSIKNRLVTEKKMDWHKTIQIKDVSNQVIAEVDKVIYIRLKERG